MDEYVKNNPDSIAAQQAQAKASSHSASHGIVSQSLRSTPTSSHHEDIPMKMEDKSLVNQEEDEGTEGGRGNSFSLYKLIRNSF